MVRVSVSKQLSLYLNGMFKKVVLICGALLVPLCSFASAGSKDFGQKAPINADGSKDFGDR